MRFSVVNPARPTRYSRKVHGNIRPSDRNLRAGKPLFRDKMMSAANREIHGPIKSLIAELGRSIDLIDTLDELSYRRGGRSSVGAQFRHDLDFAVCLLRGLATGRIDYNERERDTRVETDREYACARFGGVIRQLSEIENRILGQSVLVRSEVDPTMWLPSSVARELEFVHSHTVHHHALIAEKLAAQGIETAAAFGVAPSTLEYWDRKAA
jgi:hypothetical protein